MTFQKYNFDDCVKYYTCTEKKQLDNCAAWTYEYKPLENGKYFDIYLPDKNKVRCVKGWLLQSYGTPIMFIGVDYDDSDFKFCILFPYLKDRKASNTTWYHIRSFCKKVGVVVMNAEYMRDLVKYECESCVQVFKWW